MMKKIFTLVILGAMSLFASHGSYADLIISGVVDGTETGGNPKAIELVATADIADLSNFFLVRDTNGSAGTFTISSDFQLPMVSLNAGDFFYLYGNTDSETLLESLGFGDTDSGTAVLADVANHNGDDILAISDDADGTTIFDAFGLLGQGDTDFAANSVSYRQAGTPANPTGVADAGNFDIVAYSEAGLTSTFGTYEVAAIPEPSSLALLGFVGCAGFIRRRR